MRIGHLKEALKGPPERFVFGIWETAVRHFVEETDWVVIVAGKDEETVGRLRGAFEYFSSQQCEGVSLVVQKILMRFGVPLSRQWKVYRIVS